MAKQSRWVRREMTCPEGKGDTTLCLEWSFQQGRETLNSISCSNICLKDVSGADCEWKCWEEVTRGREREPADLQT
ncbi:MAG: hypothetical protein JRI47_00295 [Deltaproteobacteria bacterium]|nr:hypothetical protein [Deltaproteobacteria bacterium]